MKITIIGFNGLKKTVMISANDVENVVADFSDEVLSIVTHDYALHTYSVYDIKTEEEDITSN